MEKVSSCKDATLETNGTRPDEAQQRGESGRADGAH